MNFNTDEFSCAIGFASLSRLENTIQRRRKFLVELNKKAKHLEPYFRLMDNSLGQSPFFIPLIVGNEFELRKMEIAELLKLEGISLVPAFNNIVSDWEIAKKLNWEIKKCSNATSMKARSFNLFLNENYGEREVSEIVEALEKVLNYLKK